VRRKLPARPEDVEQLALQRRLALGEQCPRVRLLADGALVELVQPLVVLRVVLQLEIAHEAADRVDHPLWVEHDEVAQQRCVIPQHGVERVEEGEHRRQLLLE